MTVLIFRSQLFFFVKQVPSFGVFSHNFLTALNLLPLIFLSMSEDAGKEPGTVLL
jgi:hypothetical protein